MFFFFFFFFFNGSRIVSHLPFACNWQTRFLDSELVITHFLSNTYRTLNIRIPRNSVELHPTLCIRVICRVLWLGPSCTLKQNVLSLILLISLAELTNQKRGHL